MLWKDTPSSMIDRYADSILLNIAYNYDSDNPLRSVMLSEYYNVPYQNENINLLDSIGGELTANQQYLGYWHGMTIPVRIMHLFTDIRGLRSTTTWIRHCRRICLASGQMRNWKRTSI